MGDTINSVQRIAVVVALVSFIVLVAMPIVFLVRDLWADHQPADRGPGRAGGDPGPAGVPAPRKPVPPSLGVQAAAAPEYH